MPKLSKHLKTELLVLAAFAVGSCSGNDFHSPAEIYDLADVANANARNALYQCNEMESRIEEIESRLNM